ncbi:hypothetical protein CVIRNUC_009803 [Coccomyxa viridis]|uniref:DNA polymerase n=1 Tax=Coccomyxa viridis TaxID=1274662 RepID=A0AAV1IKX1_9CHLO|nr:hypothetical protein CVIRNUC_009803 [Coccomyxa viridis]
MPEGHVAKKLRVDRGQDGTEGGFLRGVQVYLQRNTIPNAASRSNIWARRIASAGGRLAQDVASATHILIGDKHEGLRELRLPKGRHVVTAQWLEQCLSLQERLPERDYAADLDELAQQAERQWSLGERAGPLRKYEEWLGHWKPEYDAITRETELVLQAEFSEHHEAQVGNEAIVKGLVDMRKYWDALEGDFRVEVSSEDGEDEKKGRTHSVNHGSLSFARAASVMRACAFKVQPNTDPAALKLPFIGPARAQQICDLATSGTTPELEEHRADEQVYSSRQKSGQREPYEGAVGSATRRLFKKLPGVGARTAKLWWDLGLRTFQDVEEAAKPGGMLAQGGAHPLTVPQAFSLRHRGDLLEDLPEKDVQEMRAVVLDILSSIAGEGWTMDICGGAARGLPSHDADFVVSHPTKKTGGVVSDLLAELVARGKLFPKEEAMCQTSASRMPDHVESMRKEVAAHDRASFFKLHNLAGDRHDHIFGNFRTADGRVRRIDIIIAPAEECAFCVLGWTGSRQYLRFLRQHAVDLGMALNSHRLMRKEQGKAVLVPDEAPPLDRDGKPVYPPGWAGTRPVRHECDIFELCGIPYKPPHLRNAP